MTTTLADTFYASESQELGQPIELYEFSYGGGDISAANTKFCFTSGNLAVTRTVADKATLYVPATLKRSELQHTTDMGLSTLSLATDKNNVIAQMFIPGTPAFPIFIQIYRGHVGKEDYLLMFSGRVSSCTFHGFEATIDCDPIFIAVKRQGLRMVYESMCCHSLYDLSSCNLKKEDKAVSVTGAFIPDNYSKIVVSNLSNVTYPAESRNIVSGLLIPTLTSTGAGWFTGGMLGLSDGTYYMIAKHEYTPTTLVTTISLVRPLLRGTVLTGMKLYPGCDHTASRCSVLGNSENFGGFPHFPDTNPFVGTHVPQGGA